MTEIRPVELADRAHLFELVRAFPSPTPQPDAAVLEATFERRLTDPSSFVAVAAEGDALRGYVAGYCHPTFYAGGSTAWIDELLVVDDFRRKGIGRQLMEAFEAWAWSRSCKLVSLATSGAGSFYEHLGYTPAAKYYKKYASAAQRPRS
jgi:GNAT superfamily N-acetyltransferase